MVEEQCWNCDQLVEADAQGCCPLCHARLGRFFAHIAIVYEEVVTIAARPHPDPIKRREADLAAQFRMWVAQRPVPPAPVHPLPRLRLPQEHALPAAQPPLQPQEVQPDTGLPRRIRPQASVPAAGGFKVLVVGEPAVGKTSLVLKTTGAPYVPRYRGILGVSFAVKEVTVGRSSERCVLWNLAPSLRRAGRVRDYSEGSHGVVYVFSVSDRPSFELIDTWVDALEEASGPLPGVLVGNKADVLDERRITPDRALALAQRLGVRYFETSTRDGPFLEEALQSLATTMVGIYGAAREPAVPEVQAVEAEWMVPPAQVYTVTAGGDDIRPAGYTLPFEDIQFLPNTFFIDARDSAYLRVGSWGTSEVDQFANEVRQAQACRIIKRRDAQYLGQPVGRGAVVLAANPQDDEQLLRRRLQSVERDLLDVILNKATYRDFLRKVGQHFRTLH